MAKQSGFRGSRHDCFKNKFCFFLIRYDKRAQQVDMVAVQTCRLRFGLQDPWLKDRQNEPSVEAGNQSLKVVL